MDVNFNKYSNVSFLTFVCTVFISSKNHIQLLNRSSKAVAALVKTITRLISRRDGENKGLLAGVPLLPLPPVLSRALIPFPFPFERLARRLIFHCFFTRKVSQI